MHRIEVFLTFPSLSRLVSILVLIYTPRSATRSPKWLKEEAVSLTHILTMKNIVFITFMFGCLSFSQRNCQKVGKHLSAQLHQSGG